MKNIIVGLLTLGILGLMMMTFMGGGAYQGGEHAKVIKDFGDSSGIQQAAVEVPAEKSNREKEDEALNALREKAGNVGAFQVSQGYKSKCASCHGVNGSGEQNGKKLMGPKLFGQDADKLFTDLSDFKAGRKENMIMKGLLMNLDEEELRAFADEIGEFPARAKALEE